MHAYTDKQNVRLKLSFHNMTNAVGRLICMLLSTILIKIVTNTSIEKHLCF